MSALPKLNATPKHEMVVPSTGKTVMFRPYLVKEEKILLMAFETKDEKTAMQAMLDTIDACCEGDYVKSKLTTFDIEYMFTQIRGKSVGESVDVKLICKKCETKNDMNINLSELKIDVPQDVNNIIEVTDTISIELQYLQPSKFHCPTRLITHTRAIRAKYGRNFSKSVGERSLTKKLL